jgi:hypothetical protein
MSSYGNDTYSISYGQPSKKKQEDEVQFEVLCSPSELIDNEMVWSLALKCEQDVVVPKAKDFLIRLYSCFSEEIQGDRMKFIDALIERCMSIASDSKADSKQIDKALQLVKQMIYQSERKGTGDIVPHNALLKGEVIKKIQVKDRDLHRDIYMNLHSNVTIWEMKKRIGEQMGMIPKYLKLEKGQGYNAILMKDTDNGKTL